jgi:anti-sigma factor RsiW
MLPPNTHPSNRTLIAYLDGELPSEERAQIRKHVGQCDTCRRELDFMEADLDWFLVLEAAASPIDTRPRPENLDRLLAATRQWRKCHGAMQKQHTVEQQTISALEVFLGPALAASVQHQNGGVTAEALLATFLGRRAAEALMNDIRRGSMDRLASDMS